MTPIHSVRGRRAFGKGPGTAQRDVERLELGRRLGDNPAHVRRILLAHIAEELERQVHVLRLDPLHLGPGRPQPIHEADRLGHDVRVQFDGDKGADFLGHLSLVSGQWSVVSGQWSVVSGPVIALCRHQMTKLTTDH